MHQSPHKDFQRKRRNPANFGSPKPAKAQHGCLLLDVPGEILSAITANLDPPALLALGESHLVLSRHVEEDITWRVAFETNYGTGPLLRRVEPTWRKEYYNRHRIRLRYAYSRIPSTTHSPLPAPAISHIHLLSTNSGPMGLLSLSLTYGIIARSIPFTGRVLPGFLDATGSTTGNGIGNPNAEFTPNISACAIASAGGTVRVLWGYRTGHVSFMVTNKTLENPRRPAQEFRVSQEHEMHHGSVLDIAWVGDNDLYAVSGASDGTVKVWDFTHDSTPDLTWTPTRPLTTLAQVGELSGPCIKVAGNRALGMVVAVRSNGSVDIWRGFSFRRSSDGEVHHITAALPGPVRQDVDVLALHIDPSTGDVLVALRGEFGLYRIRASLDGAVTSYGEPEGGVVLSSLQPYFTASDVEDSFIITGDKLGCVKVYDWKSDAASDSTIRPVRSFQASTPVDNKQESITALLWTPAILATGTSGGVVVVWDSLTFEHLRVIVRPVGLRRVRRRHAHHQQQGVALDEEDSEAPSPAVKQILVGEGGDTLIVNVGGEVIAWRAGDVANKSFTTSPLKGGKATQSSSSRSSIGQQHATTKGSSKGRLVLAESSGRWSQQLEMKKIIADSQAQVRHEREGFLHSLKKKDIKTAQQDHLEKLGLSEKEALDYALMLSRESQPNPEGAGSSSALGDDNPSVPMLGLPDIGSGRGDALTDEELQAMIQGGHFCSAHDASSEGNTATPSSGSDAEVDLSNVSSYDALTDEQLRAALDGGLLPADDAAAVTRASSNTTISTPTDPESDFPAMSPPSDRGVQTRLSLSPSSSESPSASPTHHASLLAAFRARKRESIGSGVSSYSSTSGGSEAARQNAWSVPLSVSRSTGTSLGNATSPGAAVAGGSQTGIIAGTVLDDMDGDLRLALELSLAEARSRGEDV